MGRGQTSFERVGAQPTTARAAGGEGLDVTPPPHLAGPCGTPSAPLERGAVARLVVYAAIQKPRPRAIRGQPFAAGARHESRVGDLSAKPPRVSRAMHGMEQPRGRNARTRHRIS